MATESLSHLAHGAYARLRQAIESGELGTGSRVTERSVAQLCAVSPTPARDAVRRLEREGLIERRGPRTLVVAEVSSRLEAQMGQVEVRLRGLIARFAAENATAQDVAELRDLLAEADDAVVLLQARGRTEESARRIVSALALFNRRLEASSHLPALVEMVNQTRTLSPIDRSPALEARIVNDPDFGADRYAEHHALVELVAAQDAAGAQALAESHASRALAALTP
jgi:DNA-binding GntR family transcriptional regulator